MIHQGDFLGKDKFIALIVDVEDINQYTEDMKKARELLNNETFRKKFIDNLMQDWWFILALTLDEMEEE